MRTVKTIQIVAVLVLLSSGCQSLREAAGPAASNIRPAGIFTDNMVLQRDIDIPVWGWADPGGRVTVALNGRQARAKVGSDGAWMVRLRPMPAGGPYTMTIRGEEALILRNVMVGDVWICSGQSNMQMPVKIGDYGVENGDAEVAAARFPNIRLFMTPTVTSFEPMADIPPVPEESRLSPWQKDSRRWLICGPDTVPPFSAVAYFFGRAVHRELDVPIGLIQTAWGGTVCEAWTETEALLPLPDLAAAVAEMEASVSKMPELQRAYEREKAAWEQEHAAWWAKFQASDPGYRDGEPLWAKPDFDDGDWQVMELPGYWESAGLPGFDGNVWYRKDVVLSGDMAGKPLTLSLGPINDMDRTWLNGVLVGATETDGQYQTPRVYSIPAGVAKAGRNVIAVRVYDMGNKGGLWGKPEELRLSDGDSNVFSLAGVWRYQTGASLAMVPPKPMPPKYRVGNPNLPGVLYNAMIAPLMPFGIRGAIWYQGESNASRAEEYRSLFPAMIRNWRQAWGQGDFPFLFVQLANWTRYESGQLVDAGWPELREAQLMTLALPSTGMAVTIDIGNPEDIHPKNKQDVGRRLALAARHVAYGQDIVYSGPVFKAMVREGDAIRLRFDHVGSGLVAKGGDDLKGFTVAGMDRRFVPATARIAGDTIVISADGIPDPVAVRYAWAINPDCNLYNREGLPASPFRTDHWPAASR